MKDEEEEVEVEETLVSDSAKTLVSTRDAIGTLGLDRNRTLHKL